MAEAKRTSSSAGWVVVLAGLGINLCLGVLYTWSLFTSALTNKWAWSAGQALTPYAIALGVFAITMVFAGRLQDRIGPRVAATIGGVLVGVGMVVASFAPKPPADLVAKFVALKPAADAAIAKGLPAAAEFAAAKAALAPFVGPSLPWLAVGFGILTGAGIGFAYAAATPAAVKWFAPTKKGLISGIVVAGFGLASLYTAPLTGSMLAGVGVNSTFLYLGIAFFIAILIFAQLIRNPPEGYVPEADTNIPQGANAPKAAHREYTWQEMIRTPQFWMMWVMYAFAAGAGLMVVGIVAKYALGIEPVAVQMKAIAGGFKGGSMDWVFQAGATFTIVMALAIGNGAGRPITGIISDRIGRTRTMMAVFIFQAILLVVLGFVNTFAVLLVVAGFIGFNYGANLTLFPAMTFDFFGTKNAGVNYGLMFTAWGAGGVLGSIGAGFAKDYFGSFNNAFYVAAGLLVVATVLAAVIRSPKLSAEAMREDEMLAEGA
jgi:OFA family oxalate/formate antiporter-like MFS transporter